MSRPRQRPVALDPVPTRLMVRTRPAHRPGRSFGPSPGLHKPGRTGPCAQWLEWHIVMAVVVAPGPERIKFPSLTREHS
jgi:hypothetical protein